MRWRPAARAAATICAASCALLANGFSTSTCLPLASAAVHHSQMCRRRQRNVNQVDVVAGDELGITTEGQGNRVLRGEILRALEIAGSDGDDFRAEQRVGRSHDAAWRDPCRAQYSDAYHGAAVSHECGRCGTLSPRSCEREQM